MISKEETARWIDEGLNQEGKTAAELARHLGISQEKVSKTRHGTRRPTAEELPIIEWYLGTNSPGREWVLKTFKISS